MIGIFSKFSVGGGEGICHSSVAPPQGLSACLFTLEKGVEEIPKHKDQSGNENPGTESG